jgi:hypothetical protein
MTTWQWMCSTKEGGTVFGVAAVLLGGIGEITGYLLLT